ncbi:MAG: hypothetical protein HY244_19905 [Rhizobiales bacterium]|nr:hypothetical protein [Hyphomicrobiales bacterium]
MAYLELDSFSGEEMAYLTQQPPQAVRHRKRRAAPGPLTAPVLLFAAVTVIAASYVAFVLWPRWPDSPVTLDAPTLPVVVAGVAFNIEPAAIRRPVQRRPGTQERVDLAYLWPSLLPPDPARKPTLGAPVDPNERLFVTIQTGDTTLPLMERVQTIYPRYLVAEPAAGPAGLTLRGFRDDTPYAGEELAFESLAPEHFLARCARKGVINSGSCLLERRIGNADITIRFPRDWLADWQSVASGIDTLIARLHPN